MPYIVVADVCPTCRSWIVVSDPCATAAEAFDDAILLAKFSSRVAYCVHYTPAPDYPKIGEHLSLIDLRMGVMYRCTKTRSTRDVPA